MRLLFTRKAFNILEKETKLISGQSIFSFLQEMFCVDRIINFPRNKAGLLITKFLSSQISYYNNFFPPNCVYLIIKEGVLAKHLRLPFVGTFCRVNIQKE